MQADAKNIGFLILKWIWVACEDRYTVGIAPMLSFDERNVFSFLGLEKCFWADRVTGVTREAYSVKRDSMTGFFFEALASSLMSELDSIEALILLINIVTSLNS